MKSYLNFRFLNLLICNDETGTLLQETTDSYHLDWFKPHSGPDFKIGSNVTVLLENSILQSLLMEVKCPFHVTKVPLKLNRKRRDVSKIEFDRFNSFDQISTYLSTFGNMEVIGRTHENRSIYALQFGDLENPTVSIDCGIHARSGMITFNFFH